MVILFFLFHYFYPTNSLIYQSFDYLKIYGFNFNYFYSRLISEDFFLENFQKIEKEIEKKRDLPIIIKRSYSLLKEEKERNFSPPPISFSIPLEKDFSFGFEFISEPLVDTANFKIMLGANLFGIYKNKRDIFVRYKVNFYKDTLIDIIDEGGNRHIPNYGVCRSGNKHMSLVIDESNISFKIAYFYLLLGRTSLSFSPSPFYSVTLADFSPPKDLFLILGDFNKLRIIYFTQALSRHKEYLRFLTFQRAEYTNKHFNIGFNIAVVSSPDSSQTKSFFGYLNPFIPLYFEVANSGHDDNFLAGFDIALFFLKRFKFYYEIFLDNIELKKERKEKLPNCYADNLGWQALLPFNLSLKLEFTKILPYTYYHRIYHLAYTHYGTPLGHPLGPDACEKKLEVSFLPAEKFSFKIFWANVQKGKYNSGDIKNKTWEEGDPVNEFLKDKKEYNYFFPSLEIKVAQYSFFTLGYIFTNEEVKNKFYLRFLYRL
uniref:Capsule assembly Wzi family protein n=1 Tax=candidate division WOR-3 bacterium TaxID=2052148 RepID=A0A7V5Y068_UNCW3